MARKNHHLKNFKEDPHHDKEPSTKTEVSHGCPANHSSSYPLIGLRFLTVRGNADTLEDKERILSRWGNQATVISTVVYQEDMVTYDFVWDYRDEKGGYGFAHFKRNADGHFILEAKTISHEEPPQVTMRFTVKDGDKVILMYDLEGIDHAVVTFRDDTTGTLLSEVRVPFAGMHYQIIDAPPGSEDPSITVQYFTQEGGSL